MRTTPTQRLRTLICDELQDRLTFHHAFHRTPADDLDLRVWIALDGAEIVELVFPDSEGTGQSPGHAEQPPLPEPSALAQGNSVRWAGNLGKVLEQYLRMPISEARKSSEPMHRALAMIDRRTKERTLEELDLAANEDPLVCCFHRLRLNVRKS